MCESRIDRSGRFARGTIRGVLLSTAIAILLTGSPACKRYQSQTPVVPTQSTDVTRIVVMPFHNLGVTEDAFLTVGMTEEITDRLGAISDLGVVSHPNIDSEQGSRPVHEIAQDLGVDYILTGSVLWDHESAEGRELVMEASLIDATDGNVVWNERFRRPMEDVFSVQSSVVHAATDNMRITLDESERQAVDDRPTNNMDAYMAFLRGILHEGSFERQEIATAERFFQEAVSLDPNFAAAHAALSESHSLTFHFRYDRSPQRLAGAIGSAHRALEINSDLPDGHRALGYYYYWGQRNYEQALTEFSMAANGRPNDPEIMSAMGVVLRRQGRWEEAVVALSRAADLDPESDIYVLDIASTYGRMRRWSNGIDFCRRAVEMAPDDIYPYVFYARIVRARDGSLEESRRMIEAMPHKDPSQQLLYWYEQAKYERDFDAARDALATAGELIPDPIDEAMLPRVLVECEVDVLAGASGPSIDSCGAALEYLQHARDLSPGDPAIHAALGWAYALTGDKAQAIEAGERAVELLPVTSDAMAGHSHLVRLAKIYAWVDEPYQAVKRIEKSLRTPGWLSVSNLRLDPDWDPIRDDPRFQELLRMHSTPE